MAQQKKSSNKISADQFDYTNVDMGENSKKKRTTEDVSEGDDGSGSAPVEQSKLQLKENAKQESELLNQGKMLADAFDSTSKFTSEEKPIDVPK